MWLSKEYLPHTYKGLALIHITRKAKWEMVFQALTYCICLMPVLKQDHKSYWKVGMVAPTCNSSTWEPEVGGWPWVRSQSKLQNENLSQNQYNDNNKTPNCLIRATLVKTCPKRQVPRIADLNKVSNHRISQVCASSEQSCNRKNTHVRRQTHFQLQQKRQKSRRKERLVN